MFKNSAPGIDGIEIEMELSGVNAGKSLPTRTIGNQNGHECGKVTLRNGKAHIYICLPKVIRESNVEPFSAADMVKLPIVRDIMVRELFPILESIENCRFKSIEVNLTQKVAGVSTPSQLLDLINRSYPNTTNHVFQGSSKQQFYKENESVYIPVKNYYAIKAYNKSLQLNKTTTNVENGLLRIEVVMRDRIIRKLFGNECCNIFEIFEENNLRKVIDEYRHIVTEEVIEKHIYPCLVGITNVLTESLTLTGKPIKTMFKHKEIILDVELLRNALKKWHELWGEPDNSRQDLYRLREYELPRDVIQTINEFRDSLQ